MNDDQLPPRVVGVNGSLSLSQGASSLAATAPSHTEKKPTIVIRLMFFESWPDGASGHLSKR